MAEIVLVEDDSELRRSLSDCLEVMGHSATGVGSAVELYQLLATRSFDAAVVDINLPHYDGFSVVEYLARATDVAIIVASARNALEDRVRGYRSGVDIYMTKPIDPEELSAAIESLGAKRAARTGQVDPVWIYNSDDMSLTAPNGKWVGLTRRETLFMAHMANAPEGAASRDDVLGALGGGAQDNGRAKLDTLVSRLRSKVRQRTGLSLPIDTVQGSGFAASGRFVASDKRRTGSL
ncbi:two-component system OmpR family response regulator [Amorphus suaedae]